MYARLTHSRIRVELASRLTCFRIHADLASPAYLGFGNIQIIILPYINVWRTPVYAWISHPRRLVVLNYLKIIWHVYTSDVLPYASGTRISRLLGVRNYLNDYFSSIKSDVLTRGTRIPRLFGVGNYLNNYFCMYLGFGIIQIITLTCIHFSPTSV